MDNKKKHIDIMIPFEKPQIYITSDPKEKVYREDQRWYETYKKQNAAVKAFKLHPKKIWGTRQ